MGAASKRLNVEYRALPANHAWSEIAVVIDVLRATTTALAALEAGIPHVRVVAEVEQALVLQGEGMLVAGERRGLRVEGFDFGNSPLEIAAAGCRAGRLGSPLALCSTNGSRALLAVQAGTAFAGCIRNAGATADAVIDAAFDGALVLLQGSGQDGRPTPEDAIAAGAILESLIERGATVEVDDAASAARQAWNRARSHPAEALLATPHGSYLASLGFADDVRYAAMLDASANAVRLRADTLTLAPHRAPC